MKFLQSIAIASLLYVILLGILFFPILTGEKDLISHDNLTFFFLCVYLFFRLAMQYRLDSYKKKLVFLSVQ
jgi:hypothetical protein